MDVKKSVRLDTDKKIKLESLDIFGNALYVGIGAATGMAQLPFGALPFGFALLCAVPQKRVAAVLAGLLFSSLAQAKILTFVGCVLLTLAIRALLGIIGGKKRGEKILARLFEENVSLRVVSAALGAFTLGLYRLFESGFLYYHLIGAVISVVLAALSCLLWVNVGNVTDGEYTEKKSKPLRAVAFMTLCVAVVWGLREVSFYGISSSALACMFISLVVMRKKGILYASFLSIFMGLAVSVTYAPLFVFSTLCYAFVSGVSPLLAAAASFSVGMAWGVYTDGIFAVSTLLAALLFANVLFLTVDKLFLTIADEEKIEAQESEAVAQTYDDAREIALVRLDDAAGRIKLLCEGFSSLSDILLDEATSEPDLSGLGEMAERLGLGLSVEIGEMARAVGEDTEDLYPYYKSAFADGQRMRALAMDYRALSDYVAGIMVENQSDYIADRELGERVSKELCKALSRDDMRAGVFGEYAKRILVTSSDASVLEKYKTQIENAVGRVCGFPVNAREASELAGVAYVSMYRVPVLDATCAGRRRSAVGEEKYCGDSFGSILREDCGTLFAYVSDGMGSGKEAAATSELCAAFLEKLLPVSMRTSGSPDVTLRMLNGFLCTRSSSSARECAATVDLGIFDLIGCRAVFYKSGAAPTYVFRDGALFKLHARTVPVGIVSEPDVGKINMELLPGDVIIMVSDGVTEGKEECSELFSMLRTRLLTHTADGLADAIMEYAEERGCTDDVSALVIKIKEKSLRQMRAG
ncbi:MAG: hypothetical protein E7677_02250 [Ruminococcaceae bacterium]|nr:hypothetical protein [Oscillospiraceae bacterium]